MFSFFLDKRLETHGNCIQNSTNIVARDIACRGGNGIAVGSLGQYVGMVSVLHYEGQCLLTCRSLIN